MWIQGILQICNCYGMFTLLCQCNFTPSSCLADKIDKKCVCGGACFSFIMFCDGWITWISYNRFMSTITLIIIRQQSSLFAMFCLIMRTLLIVAAVYRLWFHPSCYLKEILVVLGWNVYWFFFSRFFFGINRVWAFLEVISLILTVGERVFGEICVCFCC